MDQRKTVLLADAGEEFRTLLWEEMEKTGEFSVEIARDGNEILKRVKERMPDLLVMDVMLPGMDGISVLRQLQKQGDAPIHSGLRLCLRPDAGGSIRTGGGVFSAEAF